MQFNPHHLSNLRALKGDRQGWVGQRLASYLASVLGDSELIESSILTDNESDRDYIFKLVQNNAVSTQICCVAIFGWGGMRRDNARECIQASRRWLSIAEAIRSNKLSRSKAYSDFLSLRNSKSLPGMGPAFFTKIIYFLGVENVSRGYILDQWTARSANLLLGKSLIHLTRVNNAAWVSDRNSEVVYEEFCQFIERLGYELGVSADLAEEIIFSAGNKGRKQTRGAWRDYVLRHG